MSNSPKKGDVVIICRPWTEGNERNGWQAVLYTRRLRVESWGRKQATFTDVATGEFIHERGYTDSFRYVPEGCPLRDLADLADEVREHVRRSQAKHLALARQWQLDYATVARPDVLARSRATLAAMEAGYAQPIDVRPHAELVAECRARLAAEKNSAT